MAHLKTPVDFPQKPSIAMPQETAQIKSLLLANLRSKQKINIQVKGEIKQIPRTIIGPHSLNQTQKI